MPLLTEELARHAIQLALPAIKLIVADNTWGPQGLVIVVDGNGLKEPISHIMEELGPEESWVKTWGEGRNFLYFAHEKAQVSLRTGRPSGEIARDCPWIYNNSDIIYQGGVAEDTSLAVAASGAYGETDEACAWIVWNIIRLLCLREIAFMNEHHMIRIK